MSMSIDDLNLGDIGDDAPVATKAKAAVPWSNEAEQAVLGALLNDNSVASKVSGKLTEASFYDERHGAVYAAIMRLVSTNRPADIVTVHDELAKVCDAETVGGMSYLLAMSNSVIGGYHAASYADIVVEKAADRALREAAAKVMRLACENAPIDQRLEAIALALAGVRRNQMRQEPVPLSTLVVEALDRYTAMAEGKVDMGLPTGIDPLQDILHGLRPGKLYGIAARPSIGKSSAARTISVAAAKSGAPTLVLSQEMPKSEVTDCLISELGRIDNEHIQTGNLTADDVSIRYSERLAEAGVEPSVGSKGDSYDNALAETINGLYKAELIHRRAPWKTKEAVELATLEWVSWFNHHRLLEPIGYFPPAEAEANYYRQLALQATAVEA